MRRDLKLIFASPFHLHRSVQKEEAARAAARCQKARRFISKEVEVRRSVSRSPRPQVSRRRRVPCTNARLSGFRRHPVANNRATRSPTPSVLRRRATRSGACGCVLSPGRCRPSTRLSPPPEASVEPNALASSRLHHDSSGPFSNSNWIVFILVARDFPEAVLIRRRAKPRAVASLRHSHLP